MTAGSGDGYRNKIVALFRRGLGQRVGYWVGKQLDLLQKLVKQSGSIIPIHFCVIILTNFVL